MTTLAVGLEDTLEVIIATVLMLDWSKSLIGTSTFHQVGELMLNASPL